MPLAWRHLSPHGLMTREWLSLRAWCGHGVVFAGKSLPDSRTVN